MLDITQLTLPLKTKTKTKAIAKVIWSLLFLLALIVIAISDHDLASVSIGCALILGGPFLLLSLIDLGRVLKSLNGEDFRATKATWLLTQLQAALGAVCVAAGGFATYINFIAWFSGAANLSDIVHLIWIPMGILLVIVGILYIYTTFAVDRKDVSGK